MMSIVTSIVVRPASGAMARAALCAVEITAAACAAHWLAGGMLPAASWVLASAVPVFGVGVLLQRGQVSLPWALAGAATGQVFLHLALVAGTPADHMHAGGSTMWPMVVAHVVGALTTILIWSVRRRAWDVLVGASRARIPVLRRLVRLTMAGPAIAAGWLQWMASRRRGPPGWVCV